MLKSRRTICYDIFRKITRHARRNTGNESVTLRVHPRIADMLENEEGQTKDTLTKDTGIRVLVAPSKELHIEKYEIIWQ